MITLLVSLIIILCITVIIIAAFIGLVGLSMDLMSFLIVAAIIYFIVRAINKRDGTL